MKKNLICLLVTLVLILTFTSSTISFSEVINPIDSYNPKDYAEKMIILVNEERMSHGLSPLKTSSDMNELADFRNKELSIQFSHTRPNGENIITLINSYNIPWITCGENIAAGVNTPEGTTQQFFNSDKHYKILMNPDYTHIGVGVEYVPDSEYSWYWTQVLVNMGDAYFDDEYIPARHDIIPSGIGDINGDSVINIMDVILLQDYINKRAVLNELQLQSADCLKDDFVTSSDVAILTKYVLGNIPSLPVSLY